VHRRRPVLKARVCMVHSECTGGGLVKPEIKRQKVLQVEIRAGGALPLYLQWVLAQLPTT